MYFKTLKTLVALLLLAAFFATSALAESTRKTRDLVFEDGDEISLNKKIENSNIDNASVVAVKTTLELTRDGQVSYVTPSQVFKSGDKVVIVYTPNIEGYAYWMGKMSSGKYSLLFPSKQAGMDNAVSKNQEYRVPVKGGFKFDDTPGTESLLLVLSAERIPDLEKAVAEASGNNGEVSNSATQVASLEEKNENSRKTRDLVFEDNEEEEVSTRSQIAPAGEPFVSQYDLVHE